MSVIAVRVDASGVHMAVESQTTYGELRVQRGPTLADKKLWATDCGVLAAFVGPCAGASVLRRWIVRHTPDNGTEAAITDYIDAFLAWRKDHYAEAGEIDGTGFVLAFQGRAWVIDGYSISEVAPNGYMAHGSGMGPALGALYCGMPVERAVAAACAHSEYCGGTVVAATMRPDGTITGDAEYLMTRPAPVRAENEKAA